MDPRRHLLGLLLTMLIITPAGAAQFDTRQHGDLSELIMLCATEPGSARFDAAWRGWIRENPDAELEGAIQTVISRAGTIRSMAVPGMEPVRPASKPSLERIASHMRQIAGSSF